MTDLLITGSNGLLGQALIKVCQEKEIDFIATSFGDNRNPNLDASRFQSLDISNEEEVKSALAYFKPKSVVNTAAMTNVDQCEKEQERCWEINVKAVEYFMKYKLAETHFVHLSTDFVFDGENGPYKEEDQPNPLSHYAKSKWASEQHLINGNDPNWSIARTIIVYGKGHNLSRGNVVVWAYESLKEGKELNIVDDQFRSPTWAPDLAMGCYLIREKKAKGIFHLSGPEIFSMYDMVLEIAQFANADPKLVTPIKTEALGRPAPRPPKTGFDITKAREVLGYQPHTLKEALSSIFPS